MHPVTHTCVVASLGGGILVLGKRGTVWVPEGEFLSGLKLPGTVTVTLGPAVLLERPAEEETTMPMGLLAVPLLRRVLRLKVKVGALLYGN